MNDFELGPQVGQGAFGKVFKARKISTNKEVAVKIVTCKSPEGVDLALSEFWTLSDLSNNENILKFSEAYLEFKGEFEILKHGDHLNSDRYRHLVECVLKGEFPSVEMMNYKLWFTLEYCDGGDLNRYIIKHSKSTKYNNIISIQLIKGLQFLHKHNVVHRDLKPDNILVQTRSRGPLIKIADFGLSRVLSGGSRCNSACGSDFFMAPEVWQGPTTARGYQGRAADIWSAALCCWSIVDRVFFIDGRTRQKLLGIYYKYNSNVIPIGEAQLDPKTHTEFDLRELVGSFKREPNGWSGNDAEFRSLLLRALQRDPSKRPTASDFLRILMSAEKCPESNSRKRKAQNVKNSVDNRNQSESAVLGCSRPGIAGICEKKARKPESLRNYARGVGRTRRPLTDVIPYFEYKGMKISLFGSSAAIQAIKLPKMKT